MRDQTFKEILVCTIMLGITNLPEEKVINPGFPSLIREHYNIQITFCTPAISYRKAWKLGHAARTSTRSLLSLTHFLLYAPSRGAHVCLSASCMYW